MAKKKLKKKTSAKSKKKLDATPVLESAQDIWRAGLGALAMAQRERGKVAEQGAALFERLVSEGAAFEKQGKAAVDEGAANVRSGISSVRGDIEGKLEAARKQAEDRFDKLEDVFEQRV
ncbi:MAG: phasin family protein, partial [Pseudomonadota bacterium]